MKSLGMLVLDTKFPRVLGDLAHFATWPFPMLDERIKGAEPERIVHGGGGDWIDDFISAGLRLKDLGVVGLTSSCGFLGLHSRAIGEACGLPTLLSALEYLPTLHAHYGEGRVGVLTISAESLGDEHFACIGLERGSVPIGGIMAGSHFERVILGNQKPLDFAEAMSDNVCAARALCDSHPNLGAILLECTNMPPYAEAIVEAVGLPVYSLYDGVLEMYQSL